MSYGLSFKILWRLSIYNIYVTLLEICRNNIETSHFSLKNSANKDIMQITNFANSVASVAFVIDNELNPIYSNIEFNKTFKENDFSNLNDVISILPNKSNNRFSVVINNLRFECFGLDFVVDGNTYKLLVIDTSASLGDNTYLLNNKDILDAIPDILSIHDTANNILYYNKAGYDFLKVTEEVATGAKCYTLIGRKTECPDCPARECIIVGESVQTIRYFPVLEKWFDIRAYPIKNENSDVVLVIEHLRDITNQKVNEIRLKESEDQQGRLIENIPGIVYKCKLDREWTMLFMSQETLDITGYSPSDFLHNNKIAYSDIIHPEDRELVWKTIADSMSANSNFIVEYRIISKDNKTKYVWEKGKVVVDSHRSYIDGVILDITDRKTTEINLAISENKYRLLVENQNEMVVKVDRHGRFTYVNDTYCRVFGKTEEELLNKNFMPLVHDDDKEQTNIALSKLSSEPHTCYIEQRAMTEQGWRWLAWSDRAILNHENEIVEIIGVGRDITEQKALEFELIKSKKMAELSEKAKIDFVINAHKFVKESLSPLTEMARSMTEMSEITEENKKCDKILLGAIILEGLIDGFSDISLFEQNRVKFKPEKFNVSDLFEEIQSIFKNAYRKDNLEVRFLINLKGDNIIYGDRIKIKYIILHLFQIAVKQKTDHEIVMGFDIVNDFVKIFVKYLGDEIDFEKMYFIDISKKGEKIESLNEMIYPELTITKLYTDIFGGNMKTEVKSDGVQIEVEIPITKLGSKIYEQDSNQEKSPDLSGITILVAEDEKINFHLMKTILSKAGAVVKRAVSGTEAVDMVENDNTISLVFMDIKMPGLGGVEALQIIKGKKPDLPVIACTAFTQSEDLESIKNAQFDGYLPKPIRRKDLFSIIDKIIAK